MLHSRAELRVSRRVFSSLAAALLLLLTGSVCAPAQSSGSRQQRYRSRAEYDLSNSAFGEKDPRKKLDLLNRWAAEYPDSMFRQERFNEMIETQQSLSMGQEMLQTARRMAADDPKGVGNYWVTVLTVSLQQSSTAGLDQGRLAASALLQNLPITFGLSKKPVSVREADWFRERDRQKVIAERTLGWVALQQKSWEESIWRLKSVLRSAPNDAEASYWLGVALLGSGRLEYQSAALYHFARSLSVSGSGALTPAAQPLVASYLKNAYIELYGNENGLPQLLSRSKTSPFPPKS